MRLEKYKTKNSTQKLSHTVKDKTQIHFSILCNLAFLNFITIRNWQLAIAHKHFLFFVLVVIIIKLTFYYRLLNENICLSARRNSVHFPFFIFKCRFQSVLPFKIMRYIRAGPKILMPVAKGLIETAYVDLSDKHQDFWINYNNIFQLTNKNKHIHNVYYTYKTNDSQFSVSI